MQIIYCFLHIINAWPYSENNIIETTGVNFRSRHDFIMFPLSFLFYFFPSTMLNFLSWCVIYMLLMFPFIKIETHTLHIIIIINNKINFMPKKKKKHVLIYARGVIF